MRLGDITSALERIAPRFLQEEYDNSGLIYGHKSSDVTCALVSLDCTQEVLDEAITKNCQLIISHHPLVFKGIKKITGGNATERILEKAIQHGIAIYAIHTNLDNVFEGVNRRFADLLGLEKPKILKPITGKLGKLITYVPSNYSETVRNALFKAGAGHIGDYSECSFVSSGVGSFKPEENANPFVGEIHTRHYEKEDKVETIFPLYKLESILAALRNSHPYEEIAYDVMVLANENLRWGAGMIGDLKEPMTNKGFIQYVKNAMNLSVVRAAGDFERSIKKVALCGGSGSFLLNDAISQNADVFISADFKYHEFFNAENQLLLMDIGHYESERATVDLIYDFLQEIFPTFALLKTTVDTNPINYF